MSTVIAHALLAAGGYSCALALMRAYQKLFPLVIGVALIGLGFGVLPSPPAQQPSLGSLPLELKAVAPTSAAQAGNKT